MIMISGDICHQDIGTPVEGFGVGMQWWGRDVYSDWIDEVEEEGGGTDGVEVFLW